MSCAGAWRALDALVLFMERVQTLGGILGRYGGQGRSETGVLGRMEWDMCLSQERKASSRSDTR